MDIKNLSEKEREALLSKLQAEKKRKDRDQKKNYQKLRARFLASVERKLRKYIKDGQEFKEWLRKEATAYYDQLKEVSVKGNRVKGFDERADVAEKRLVDYLNAWIGKKGDDGRNPMYKLAMSLLQRNEAGDLDYKSISRLYELEDDFNDPEYSEIMQLFRESNVVEGTVIRFYFEEKDGNNQWKRIEPSFNKM